MEFSFLALLGISLAAMFFGYFFGLFEGRGQGYKKRRNEEASDPSLRPAAPAPVPSPSPPEPVAPAAPAAPLEQSLLRLSLDAGEQPCLEMDGQSIDTSRMDPQQRRRLIDLMVVMRPWIESGPVQKAAPAPAAAPRATVPPFDSQSGAAAAPARTTGPLSMPPAPAEPAATAPTTMVGQIDAILQTKIAGTPLAGRGIRLVESAQGGAMVVVGLSRYAGVAEVPDPEVQAVIRAAIAEWENRYTPS